MLLLTSALGRRAARAPRLLLGFTLLGAAPARAQSAPDRATVPLIVEGNRPFIDVRFTRADGSVRTARLLLDTGGGGFILVESLARDLGLTWGTPSREEGSEFAMLTSVPSAKIGELPLTLSAQRVGVLLGKDNFLPAVAPGRADGMIPGHVLAQYHVVFDYPAGRFTIATPNVLTPVGTGVPMPVAKRSGFPRTEIVVGDSTYGMLIDTGASFTMVSELLLKKLGAANPSWRRYPGAHGDAATLGGTTLETMTVPTGRWSAYALSEFGITSQREGTFERYMSGMMASPIVGSLAGNVLKAFRVELDFQHERLYLSKP